MYSIDWLFRRGSSKPSCSCQDKYFGVRLFSRPAMAVTLCWLIPLIFPDWTSSVSAFRETTITWLATSNKTRIVPPPNPSLYFSPTSSSSLSLIPLFNFLTLPPKASRCQRITAPFVSILLSFVSPLPAALSLCPPLWAIYVKAGSSSAPLGWWIESWLRDRQLKLTIHKPWAEYAHLQGCNYDVSKSFEKKPL